MPPKIHAWECICGTRNAPQLDNCRQCGKSQHAGSHIYVQEVLPDPGSAPRVASPSQSLRFSNPFSPWQWGCATFIVCVILLIQCGQNAAQRDAPKEAAAFSVYQQVVDEVSQSSPGVLSGVGWNVDGPVLRVSDMWYRVPDYLKLRLIDNAGERWQKCREGQGLQGYGHIYVQDAGGRFVARYSSSSGASLEN